MIDLYHGLLRGDRALIVHAYETWGFGGLSNELIEILNIWASFIYGPLLEDRVRAIAEHMTPGVYGRREAFSVHKILREKGPVKVPREFVFMDRAAIGLGGVFLHSAPNCFYRLFDDTIDGSVLPRWPRANARPSPRPACRCPRGRSVARKRSSKCPLLTFGG